MSDSDRKMLLNRIDRGSATVGAEIPAEITVDGTTISLRDKVFELTRGADTADASERIDELLKLLRQHRKELRSHVTDGDVSYSEAESIVDTIIGIDRAISKLESAGSPSVSELEKRRKTADQRRWMSFLDEALGKDKGRRNQ